MARCRGRTSEVGVLRLTAIMSLRPRAADGLVVVFSHRQQSFASDVDSSKKRDPRLHFAVSEEMRKIDRHGFVYCVQNELRFGRRF